MALPAGAQARCQVWRALVDPEDARLQDLVMRSDGEGGIELAYLGVADGPGGAESCEMSFADGVYTLDCDWPAESEADAIARLEGLQRGIEGCLRASFEHHPDFVSGSTGGALTHRRGLEIERRDGGYLDLDLQIYSSGTQGAGERGYSVSLRFEREQ